MALSEQAKARLRGLAKPPPLPERRGEHAQAQPAGDREVAELRHRVGEIEATLVAVARGEENA